MTNTMTKLELHKLIKNTISYIHQKEKGLYPNKADAYHHAIIELKKLDETIDQYISKDERTRISDSAALFGSKELEIYDRNDVGAKFALANFEYSKYFGIIDPDILKLIINEK